MTDSRHLIAEYSQNGSEAAFRALVARFVDLVYSTALRLVGGDTHRAEDVAQTVFVDLARTAGMLANGVRLGGWLHRHTCFVAANTMRGERRRQARERQAAEMNALQTRPQADFAPVAPVLDEAINELGEADRRAILLRFFEQQDFRSVGQALGSSEDAARMRVTRALERLASLLKRRGVTTSATSLGLVLAANAVQAAPAGLAVTVSTAAALAVTTLGTTTTAVAVNTIAMTTLQKAAIAAAFVAAVGTGIHEARQAATLRSQNQVLEQQHSPLLEQVRQRDREQAATASELSALREENRRLSQNTVELARLRAEVTQLRALQTPVAQAKAAADPFIQSVLDLTTRAAELNQHLARMPEKRIPELQWLSENDWLNAAQDATLDNDANIRRALSGLRSRAKARLYPILQPALLAYVRANEGQLPAELADLRPYFEKPVDDAVLQRYKLLRTGSAKELGPSDWVIAERAPVDQEHDTRLKLGLYSMQLGSTGTGEAETYEDSP